MIERLDTHPFRQRGDVQPSDPEAFLDQRPLQDPAGRERKFHAQLVDPVHQFQIGIRDRACPRTSRRLRPCWSHRRKWEVVDDMGGVALPLDAALEFIANEGIFWTWT